MHWSNSQRLPWYTGCNKLLLYRCGIVCKLHTWCWMYAHLPFSLCVFITNSCPPCRSNDWVFSPLENRRNSYTAFLYCFLSAIYGFSLLDICVSWTIRYWRQECEQSCYCHLSLFIGVDVYIHVHIFIYMYLCVYIYINIHMYSCPPMRVNNPILDNLRNIYLIKTSNSIAQTCWW